MPVVPFSSAPKQQVQRKLSAAEEPWLLMAAAQMDAQGRLVEDEAPVGASEVNPNAT
jgi:hypothetical protein